MPAYWLILILLLVICATTLYAVVACVCVVAVALWRRRRTGSAGIATCRDAGSPRPLTLAASDGTSIDACFLPAAGPDSAAGNFVLLHGIDDRKERLLPLAGELADAGYNCLLLDFRGHGRSGPGKCTYGWYERLDVRAGVDWLAANCPGRIAVYGQSLGAAVAFLAAADDERIRAVVADGAYSRLRQTISDYAARCGAIRMVQPPAHWLIEKIGRFRIDDCDPLAVAPMLGRPVLLIHGLADRHISPDHARELAGAMDGQCQLWLIPKAAHLRCHDVAGRAYVERIDAFVRPHLAGQ